MRYFSVDSDPRPFLLARGVRYEESVAQVVADTIADVRRRGDAAMLESARKYDAPGLESILATQHEMDEAMPTTDQAFAIDHAIERVKAFHERQLEALTKGWTEHEFESVEERRLDGQPRHHVGNHRWDWNMAVVGQLGQRLQPLRRAGIYVRAATPIIRVR